MINGPAQNTHFIEVAAGIDLNKKVTFSHIVCRFAQFAHGLCDEVPCEEINKEGNRNGNQKHSDQHFDQKGIDSGKNFVI